MSTEEKTLEISANCHKLVSNAVKGRPAYFVENNSNPVLINVLGGLINICALVLATGAHIFC